MSTWPEGQNTHAALCADGLRPVRLLARRLLSEALTRLAALLRSLDLTALLLWAAGEEFTQELFSLTKPSNSRVSGA